METGWDDIRYFLALHRTGTLSAAARALGVSHATVGRRISAFAERMGGELFQKTPDQFLLSELGESLLQAAHEVEASFLRLDRLARGFDDTLRGRVRVSTNQILAKFLVIPAAVVLNERHPEVVVDVDESTRFISLSRQEADIAVRMRFRPKSIASGDVRIRRIGGMAWAPFATSRAQRAVISYNEFAPGRVGDDWVEQRPEFTTTMSTSSMYVATYAAKQGIGIAFLPIVVGESEGLEQLGEPVAWMDVVVARHPDLDRNARVRMVFDTIVSESGEIPGLFQES